MSISKIDSKSFRANIYIASVLTLLIATIAFVFPLNTANAAGTVNGRVFLDYNLNGVFDSSGTAPNYSVDVGVVSVRVTAYDSAGLQQGTVLTNATGTYSLAVAGAGPYRIEFTQIPAALKSGEVGGTNASTVRFINDGTTNNVDLSISSQQSYCQNNPLLLTNCYIEGDFATGDVLVDFPYSAGAPMTATTMAPYRNPTTHSVILDQTQIGPTWGLAYSRLKKRVYAASYFKKHTLFGPGGPGAIYEIDPSNNSVTNTITVPGATTNSHGTVNVCTGTHTVSECDNGNTGWDAVGKTALGGLALSEDESLLYVMNLQNRTLYEITRSTGVVARWQSFPGVPNVTGSQANLSSSANLPPGSVINTNVRPFAVQWYQGKLYVGVVTSAQTTSTTLTNLRAHVYEVDPSNLSFTLRFSVPLNYNRGDLLRTPGGASIPAEWNAWTTAFTAAGSLATGLGSDETGYPQPMLTGINFDDAGNLQLGLRDRGGDQFGAVVPSNPAVNINYIGESAGDTLLACGNTTSGWTLESNSRCGGMGTGVQNNGQGIGNGEYFHGENWTDGRYSHNEISLGGLDSIAGRGQTVATVFDPANLTAGAFSAGARWLDDDQGDAERAYNLFTSNLGTSPTFAKANGLGDVISLCDSAPIQIGNRVWNDVDRDGIQDPGETTFANVGLELWVDTDNDGIADTLRGTTTSDVNGNYLFGGFTNANMSTYTCGTNAATESSRVDRSSDDAEQNAAGGAVLLTSADLDFLSNTGSAPNYDVVGMRFNNVDIPANATITGARIEFTANEASVSGGSPTFSITAQNSGNPTTFLNVANNLSTLVRPRTANTVSWSPPAWGNNSIQNTADLTSLVNDIRARGDWASGNSMAFFVSGAVSTAYREAESFDGDSTEAPRLIIEYTTPKICTYEVLPETAYEVRLASNSFDAGQPLFGFVPTSTDADPSANGDSRDSDGFIAAGDIVKTAFTTGKNGANNHTYDFGFKAFGAGLDVYSLGNRLWYDTDNDGIIDPTEVGIPGVSVSIFVDADGGGVPDTPGSPVATVTSDANGYYRFDSLTANNYVVRINPSNFASGAIFEGYKNTAGINTADAESFGAGSNAENGVNPATAASVLTNGILSNSITLSAAAEPTAEADVPSSGSFAGQGAFDAFGDMTVDLGFYGLNLSGTVWNDRGAGADNNDGELDAAETRLPTFNVRLYDSAGNEIPVGADGILGTSDDAPGGIITGASGTYNFQGLDAGDYRVVLDPQGYASSTPTEADPDDNGDDNDNGFPDNTTLFPSQVISGIVTLTPGNTGALSNNTVTNSNGKTSNPTVDFGLLLAATQVEMDKYEAFYKGGSVVIEWSTGGESDNLGFNVYRSSKGGRDLLNMAPIAGSALRTNVKMSVTGNDYRWVDNSPQTGAEYYLEDIDLYGVATVHGPIRPNVKFTYSPEVESSNMLTDYLFIEERQTQREYSNLAERADETDATQQQIEKQREIAARGGIKISVPASDRYRIPFTELGSNGFDLSSTEKWQLYSEGTNVPFRIIEDVNGSESIEFYGRGFESRFTAERTYYLVQGGEQGLRLNTVGEKGIDGPVSANSFRTTSIRKDRGIYLSALLNGEDENWFGAAVLASSDANQEIFAYDPDQAAGQNAVVRVKLQGFTAVEHLVNVSFNGVQIGTVEYVGSENREFELDVPMASVIEGSNIVTLRSAGGSSDISLVDEVALTYSRQYKVRDGKLRFSVDAGESARIHGFEDTDFEVFELNESGNALRMLDLRREKVNGIPGFSLRANGSKREFAAYDNSYQAYEPEFVDVNYPSGWSSPKHGSEMIILAPMLFAEQAAALRDLKRQQGIKAYVVYIEDVYDEFGFGRKSGDAVKDFLEHAASTWTRAPRYVILFGDSSYDMRNYQAQEIRDLIPTNLVDTKTMETASDAWLADFDDDGVEDLAIGRLPAGNVEEATQMVAKLVRYNQQPTRSIQSNLLVADKKFENYNDALEAQLPSGVVPVRLNRSSLADSNLKQQIKNEINDDAMVVTYTGHGSTSVWGSNSVFGLTEAANLTNSKLSFFMLMTCLNGHTHNTNIDSLGEVLFKSENGAIAIWASSGSTYAGEQIAMSQAVTPHLFNGSSRIGDLTRAAKLMTADPDARRTWNLIGDPSIAIK